MIAQGEITGWTQGGFNVFVPCVNHVEEVKRCGRDVLIEIPDTRPVTRAQQKKAHVLLNAIVEHTGYTPLEVVKWQTKMLFLSDAPTLADWFSLSNCSVEVARLYITWLIDFCLVNEIPCNEPLWKLAEDVPRYVYACLMQKVCCVCGRRRVHLHHAIHPVGMRQRKTLPMIGMLVLSLCGRHHNEIHVDERGFLERYILRPIPLTDRIAEVYHLTAANRRPAAEHDCYEPDWLKKIG